MLMRRLKGPPGARPCGNERQQRRQANRGYSWDAVWIQPEQIIEEGILMSKRQVGSPAAFGNRDSSARGNRCETCLPPSEELTYTAPGLPCLLSRR
jgi:hypothetical protein